MSRIDAGARAVQLSTPVRSLVVAMVLGLVVAIALRFVNLDSNPPGLWQDEASTGADAWLIWHKGQDRAGESFPILSRSFGDYPFATYRYLVAPIVGSSDRPTPAHERSMAAILSLVLLVAAVIIARRAFGFIAALGTCLSASICPTWLLLARYGSEQILLPVFLALSLWAFEVGKRSGKMAWFWASAALLGVSAYSYHAAKVFVPIWSLGFLVYAWPQLRVVYRQHKRHVLGPVVLVLLLVAPSIWLSTTPHGMARAKDAAAFMHMRPSQFVTNFFEMFAFYVSPVTLFASGPNNIVNVIPGLGLWSWFDAPFVLLGMVAAIRIAKRERLAGFILFWLLIGPLPGAIGYERGSVTRLIGWNPAPALIAGLGFRDAPVLIQLALRRASGPVSKVAPLAVGGILWATAAAAVGYHLLVRYPKISQKQWQYEISASLRCARAHATPNQRIVVSPSFAYAETFAQYYFPTRIPDWTIADREVVGPDEIYVFPASRPMPKGRVMCEIPWAAGGHASFAVAHE